MVEYKNLNIPLKIGKHILENSLFRTRDLMLRRGKSTSFSNIINIKRSEDIDVGVCGIILFLIELNKIKPEPRLRKSLLDAGEDLMNHCITTSRSHYGFYKGRAGVCYTLMKLTEASGNEKYLDFAKELIGKESDKYILSEFTSNCLYDGRAGLLLVLLHFYNFKPEDWILERINLCIDKIIGDFVLTEQGIIWNKRDINIKPLNSFLFGSSGVAFLLTQVGDLFKNAELLSLAKSIFAYEDLQWNDEQSNWPDFRKEIITSEDYKIHKYKYLSKAYSFFTIPSESYDWAYGTTGLCMARLPLINKEIKGCFKSLIVKGISNLLDFKTEDLSLANGMAGVGSLLIDAAKYLNVPSYKKTLEIESSTTIKPSSYQDISLFYGITGVGYFLLQLLKPEDFHSVLFPALKNNNVPKKKETLKIKVSGYIIKSLQLTFPITFFTLQTFTPNRYQDLIEKLDFQIYDQPDSFMRKFILSFKNIVTPKQNQLICDVFALELAKLRMFNETKSYSMNHIKEIVKFEDKVSLLNMEEQQLLNQTLVFDDDSQIITAKWNWARLNQRGVDISQIISEFLTTEPKEVKLLLMMSSTNEIIEEKLDTFGQLTQSIFQEPQIVRNAINAYMDAFEIKNDTDKERILNYVNQYINYYIKRSLLHRRM